MKRFVFFSALFIVTMHNADAYNFSATAPTGQTLYYTITSNNTVEIVAPYDNPIYYGLSGNLTIPSTVTNNGTTYTVTSINGAFKQQSGLTSVIIPNTITYIGSNSFSSTGLTSVVMGNGVATIDSWAFSNCDNLTSISWSSSLTEINSNAFFHCHGLTTLELPNSVIRIRQYAFQSCVNLTSVSLGNSLVSLGESAFYGCTNLSSVLMPNTLTTIGSMSFKNCNHLSSVVIPNSVTSIGQEAFSRTGLQSVTLGSSVSSIGADAFRNCNNLQSVVSKASIPPTMQYYTFGDPGGITVTIPCGAMTAYQNNEQWSVFTNMQEQFVYSFSAVTSDATKGSVSVTANLSCNNSVAHIEAIPNSEYHFAQWSDGNIQNPRDLTVSSDVDITAIFADFQIVAESSDASQGNVSGGGFYNNGETAVLRANAANGYRFSHWQDDNTQNPRTITVTGNATFIAYFVATQEIDDVIADDINIYSLSGQILVETAQKDEIYIYDILGRKVDGGRKSCFEVPRSGLYIVKIGDLPTKKIVVIR